MKDALYPVFPKHSPITREMLAEEYLDWRNNYLSPEVFGEHRGMRKEEAEKYVELIRMIASKPHPEA